jgi:hypothetical protein
MQRQEFVSIETYYCLKCKHRHFCIARVFERHKQYKKKKTWFDIPSELPWVTQHKEYKKHKEFNKHARNIEN